MGHPRKGRYSRFGVFFFILTNPQKEEDLLVQLATTGDSQTASKLLQTPGWQTLMTILRESGGYPSQHLISAKRASPSRHEWEEEYFDRDGRSTGKTDVENERLTKRFKGFSLMDPKV